MPTLRHPGPQRDLLRPNEGWLEAHERRLLDRVRRGDVVRGEDVIEVLHDIAELRLEYAHKMRGDVAAKMQGAR